MHTQAGQRPALRAFYIPCRSVIPSEAEGSVAPGLLKGGSYTSHHDHRMVMALKVAAIGADSPIVIDDEECVAKSFPQFHEMFDSAVNGGL